MPKVAAAGGGHRHNNTTCFVERQMQERRPASGFT